MLHNLLLYIIQAALSSDDSDDEITIKHSVGLNGITYGSSDFEITLSYADFNYEKAESETRFLINKLYFTVLSPTRKLFKKYRGLGLNENDIIEIENTAKAFMKICSKLMKQKIEKSVKIWIKNVFSILLDFLISEGDKIASVNDESVNEVILPFLEEIKRFHVMFKHDDCDLSIFFPEFLNFLQQIIITKDKMLLELERSVEEHKKAPLESLRTSMTSGAFGTAASCQNPGTSAGFSRGTAGQPKTLHYESNVEFVNRLEQGQNECFRKISMAQPSERYNSEEMETEIFGEKSCGKGCSSGQMNMSERLTPNTERQTKSVPVCGPTCFCYESSDDD